MKCSYRSWLIEFTKFFPLLTEITPSLSPASCPRIPAPVLEALDGEAGGAAGVPGPALPIPPLGVQRAGVQPRHGERDQELDSEEVVMRLRLL